MFLHSERNDEPNRELTGKKERGKSTGGEIGVVGLDVLEEIEQRLNLGLVEVAREEVRVAEPAVVAVTPAAVVPVATATLLILVAAFLVAAPVSAALFITTVIDPAALKVSSDGLNSSLNANNGILNMHASNSGLNAPLAVKRGESGLNASRGNSNTS